MVPARCRKGTADVGGDQVEDGSHGGGITFYAKASIEEDGGDLGTGEEVLHVAVTLVELFHLSLQLGIDRYKLLIQGLQGSSLEVSSSSLVDWSSSLVDWNSSLIDISSSFVDRKLSLEVSSCWRPGAARG